MSRLGQVNGLGCDRSDRLRVRATNRWCRHAEGRRDWQRCRHRTRRQRPSCCWRRCGRRTDERRCPGLGRERGRRRRGWLDRRWRGVGGCDGHRQGRRRCVGRRNARWCDRRWCAGCFRHRWIGLGRHGRTRGTRSAHRRVRDGSGCRRSGLSHQQTMWHWRPDSAHRIAHLGKQGHADQQPQAKRTSEKRWHWADYSTAQEAP